VNGACPGGGWVDHRRWYERSWLAWALGGLMLLVAGLDLAFPAVAVLPSLVVLVMAAALLVGPRATAWLAVFATVLMVVGGAIHDDYAIANGWLDFAGVFVAGVIAVLLSLELDSQRERLVEREAQYRLLAENASDIVARVGLDGTLEWVSPSVRSVLGHEPESMVGTHPWDLIHPDDRAAAAANLADAALPGHRPVPLATRFRRADGTYVWLSASG
jgi:PAS domain S-box-containing protein